MRVKNKSLQGFLTLKTLWSPEPAMNPSLHLDREMNPSLSGVAGMSEVMG